MIYYFLMAGGKGTEKLEEKTPEELILVGEEYLAEGKYEEAIEVYKDIVRRDPLRTTLAKTCNDCGVAYASLEQYDMAIGFFNVALNLKQYLMDEGISACYNLARIYRLTDDDEKAELYIKRADLIREEQKRRTEEAERIFSSEAL